MSRVFFDVIPASVADRCRTGDDHCPSKLQRFASGDGEVIIQDRSIKLTKDGSHIYYLCKNCQQYFVHNNNNHGFYRLEKNNERS